MQRNYEALLKKGDDEIHDLKAELKQCKNNPKKLLLNYSWN